MPVSISELAPWRELFRQEMAAQVVHDSLHGRAGWTQSYLLAINGVAVGYGSVAVAGPWKGTRTVFEFYLSPDCRHRAFDLFEVFLHAGAATHFEIQTNDRLLTVLSQHWAESLASEKIVFADGLTTALAAPGKVVFRRATPGDAVRKFAHQVEPEGDWLLEVDGVIAATGGALFHYNPPYGDLYYEVAEPFRRRGLGTYLAQELKRVCRADGGVPCARCNTSNTASRRTLARAGFEPVAHILVGTVKRS